jgi:hypothetical protein
MSLIEIQWHPTGRQLRVFGVSGLLASVAAALVLCFLWGAALFWAILVLTAGTAIFLCSLISPRLARILYVGLALVGLPIGFVISLVLLAAFYFLLLTPLAFVFRLIGRDSLHRRWDAKVTSYWVPHQTNEDTERYFHQF